MGRCARRSAKMTYGAVAGGATWEEDGETMRPSDNEMGRGGVGGADCNFICCVFKCSGSLTSLTGFNSLRFFLI